MALISKTVPVAKSTTIENKMKSALDVFTKALNNLVSVRQEAEKHHNDVSSQIVNLQDEKEKIANQMVVLDSKIGKIKDIVE